MGWENLCTSLYINEISLIEVTSTVGEGESIPERLGKTFFYSEPQFYHSPPSLVKTSCIFYEDQPVGPILKTLRKKLL